MTIIFEDDDKSVLIQSYKRFYSQFGVKVIGACGYLNIENVINNIVGSESIIVYMDVVPDNPEIVMKYNELRLMYRKRNLLIVPIPCSEYYLIKKLCDPLDKNVSIAINREDYRHTEIVMRYGFCKSFEKYCKKVLNNLAKECAKHHDICIGTDLPEWQLMQTAYYRLECAECINCEKEDTLDDKISQLLKGLPIFVKWYKEESVIDVKACINDLIGQYNTQAALYRKRGFVYKDGKSRIAADIAYIN